MNRKKDWKRFLLRLISICLLPAILVVGCDTENLYHQVYISQGEGSGAYSLGTPVAIQADEAPTGMAFYAWVGDTAILAENRSPATSFTMPLYDVELEATFRDLPKYALIVESGTGSGEYLEGTVIQIEAGPGPDLHVFEAWAGDTPYLEDPNSAVTQVLMPDQSVTVRATYQLNPDLVSFSAEVFPIINSNCSLSGCHDANSQNNPLTSYEEIVSNVDNVEYLVGVGTMPPPPNLLSQAEKELILLWIDQGAPNN